MLEGVEDFDAALLRLQPARGRADRPAAAPLPGMRLGGAGARRLRPALVPRLGRRVRRHEHQHLPSPALRVGRARRRRQRLPGGHRQRQGRAHDDRLLQAGPARAEPGRADRLLDLAGRGAPRGRSLLDGECDMALAGGVSIRVPDRVGYRYTPGGMESPDGTCAPSTPSARDHVRGRRRRRGAEAARPTRSRTATPSTRSSGARRSTTTAPLKVGFTAPSVAGQAPSSSRALRDAGVAPETISLRRGARHRHPARRPDRGRGPDPGLRRRRRRGRPARSAR